MVRRVMQKEESDYYMLSTNHKKWYSVEWLAVCLIVKE